MYASRSEATLRDFEAAPLAQQHVGRGHPYVLKQHLGVAICNNNGALAATTAAGQQLGADLRTWRVVFSEHCERPNNPHSRRIHGDQNHALLSQAVGIRVCLAHENAHFAAGVHGTYAEIKFLLVSKTLHVPDVHHLWPLMT